MPTGWLTRVAFAPQVKVADMPLPPPRKFLLTTLIMSDVPVLPGIVKPVITVCRACICPCDGAHRGALAFLQVRTAPRQHGDSKVVYNSVWDNPDPAEYVQGQGCIVFQVGGIAIRVVGRHLCLTFLRCPVEELCRVRRCAHPVRKHAWA